MGTLTAIGLVTLGPKAYGVYRLNQITGSVGDVRSAWMDSYAYDGDGNERRAGRTIYSEGRWRLERGEEVEIWTNGDWWSYDPKLRRVLYRRQPNGPFRYNPSGFSVRSMIRDMGRWNWRQKIEIGTRVVDARELESVTLTDGSNRERSVFLADPKTHLPVEILIEANTARGWRLSQRTRPRFNVPVSAELFEKRYPAGTVLVDEEKEKTAWRAKLEKPLATFDVKGSKVALREVCLTSRGHLFVLYTNGETVADRRAQTAEMMGAKPGQSVQSKLRFQVRPKFTATDAQGTVYEESFGTFQPYVGSSRPGFERGPSLRDGQVLQGAWLLPKTPYVAGKRAITLRICENDGSLRALAEWKSVLDGRRSGPVPVWMPMVGMGPEREDEILLQERDSQRRRAETEKDWAQVETLLREDLAYYLRREREGVSYAKGDTYYRLYSALKSAGKRDEAREFLRLASQEALYPNQYPATEIRKAMESEGMQGAP